MTPALRGPSLLLRDDDTNFFTDPETLERAYRDVWSRGPVSLAVIPYVRGGVQPFVPERARHSLREYPLGENAELAAFLRDAIAAGRICVMLHGCTHADGNGLPEFAGGDDLAGRLRRGRVHLEDVLGVPITTFVPPHNRLSLAGYRAVRSEGLHLLNLPAVTTVSRPLSWAVLRTAAARVWYHTVWHCEYPRPVYFDGHWEIGCQPLTPRSSLRGLGAARTLCQRNGWPLAIATHHWELDAPLGRQTLHEVLQGVLSAMEIVAPLRLVSPDAVFAEAGPLAVRDLGVSG